MEKINSLKEMSCKEIEYVSFEEHWSLSPKDGEKLIFTYEVYRGEFSDIDLFFIVHLDKNFNEIARYNYTRNQIQQIKWKN